MDVIAKRLTPDVSDAYLLAELSGLESIASVGHCTKPAVGSTSASGSQQLPPPAAHPSGASDTYFASRAGQLSSPLVIRTSGTWAAHPESSGDGDSDGDGDALAAVGAKSPIGQGTGNWCALCKGMLVVYLNTAGLARLGFVLSLTRKYYVNTSLWCLFRILSAQWRVCIQYPATRSTIDLVVPQQPQLRPPMAWQVALYAVSA